jgi:hypothetical protein
MHREMCRRIETRDYDVEAHFGVAEREEQEDAAGNFEER